MASVLSLFIPHFFFFFFFFWCIVKVVFRDCGISCVFSLIFLVQMTSHKQLAVVMYITCYKH